MNEQHLHSAALIRRALATRYALLSGRKVYMPKQVDKIQEVAGIIQLWNSFGDSDPANSLEMAVRSLATKGQ